MRSAVSASSTPPGSSGPRNRDPSMMDDESPIMDGIQKRVRQDKVTDVIATELRRLIVLEGSVGDHLPPERVLMEQFGVSRPTLREALRVLEAEGLVRIRRGAK